MRIGALLVAVVLTGCAVAGPAALRNGRATYNEVINRTEDEQVLAMIVRHRYDETFGMLAVASVTASLRVGAAAGANAGIGPGEDYAGNLVPLSAGVTWEENPTISYVPMRGGQFIERMLAPIGATETLRLARMNLVGADALRVLVRRANGLANPLYAAAPTGPGFDRFVALYARLRDQGVVDIVRSGDSDYVLLCHDYSPVQVGEVAELLHLLGVEFDAGAHAELGVPLRFFVGSARGDGIDFETPSALEVIEAAGRGVDVPADHLAQAIARAPGGDDPPGFVAIRSSTTRPAEALVAIEHRGWWFFIDARDARSKQGFLLLRTLIGLRLDDVAGQQSAPVLTLPVGR